MRPGRPLSLLFGASLAILAVGWTRGVGGALGGDAIASNSALAALSLAIAFGASRRSGGAAWNDRWAGAFGCVVASFAPWFESEVSRIYHLPGGGFVGASLSGLVALALALPVGAGVGRGLGRIVETSPNDPVAPGLLGAAAGIALADLVPVGAGWGTALLLLASVGLSLPSWIPAEAARERVEASGWRGRALQGLAGLSAAAAVFLAVPLLIQAAQFHPGRTFDRSAVLLSLLACGSVGAVAFGGLFEGRWRAPAAFGFVGLTGAASILSLTLVARLSEPSFYQGYARLFAVKLGAGEGNLLYDAVFACGLGSLASFAAGAGLRTLLATMRNAGAIPLAGGIGAGLIGATVALAPAGVGAGIGFRGATVGAGLALAALGATGALLAPGALAVRAGSAAGALAAVALAVARAPERVRVSNPFDFKEVALLGFRETADGFSAAAATAAGEPVVRLDRNVLESDSADDDSGRLEIAISCARARRLDRVLLLGTPVPRLVALLHAGGARSVEAAPRSIPIGEAAQVFASREEERVAGIHRAPGGLAGPYDLVLVLPEAPWLAGVSRSFTSGRIRALRRLAGPGGLLAVWLDAGALPFEALEEAAGSAGLPYADLYAAPRGMSGVSIGFLRGAGEPALGRLRGDPVLERAGLGSPADLAWFRLPGTPGLQGPRPFVSVRGCLPSFERRAAGAWTPPDESSMRPVDFSALWARRARALDLLARWAGPAPIHAFLEALSIHARAQLPDNPLEKPWDRIEVAPEEIGKFSEAARAAPQVEPLARFLEEVGDLLLEKREYSAVYEAFTALVGLAPDRPGYRRILGTAHLELLDPEGAASHLERAFEAAPDDSGVAALLGRAWSEKGERPRARAFLEAENARRPGEVRILCALARVLLESEEETKAREWVEQALRVAPLDSEAANLRARLK